MAWIKTLNFLNEPVLVDLKGINRILIATSDDKRAIVGFRDGYEEAELLYPLLEKEKKTNEEIANELREKMEEIQEILIQSAGSYGKAMYLLLE